MKRYIIIIPVLLGMSALLSGSVCAQALTGKGVKVGLNMAKPYGEDVEGMGGGADLRFKMGLCAGVFITLSVTEVVALQPEVLYTQKGIIWEWEENDTTIKWIQSLDYLEIPLLVKLSLPTQGTVKPHLFVGPFIGYNIVAKVRAELDGFTSPEADIKDDVKDIELGLVLGGGADFGLPTSKITFDVRYTLGLPTFDEHERDIKNGVISFLVGYSF